ncbi:MAG: serine/threonine-protein kinase, partial [Myxococcota bacterium]
AEEREAFLREARVVAAVKHRHVVDVLDVGEDGDLAYVVMELLRGQSLADLLYETVVGTADALRLTAQILGALGAVHDAGVVHRDLKPENVFLAEDADGVLAKLIDFGVSRFVGNVLGETPGRSLRSVLPTIENRLIGTPEYMSPEQAQALPDVDHRSDLYATGVMLYEMLAGQLPFEAQTRAILLIRVVTDEAPAIERHRPDLAGPLSDFLQQALAKKREERFQDARSMRLALIRAAERLLRGTKREDADSIARAIEAAYEPGDSTLIRLPLQTPRDEVSTEDALAMPPGGGADGADGAAAETEPPRRAALSTGSRAAAEAAAAGFDEQTDWDPVDAEGPDSTQVTLPGRDLRPRAAVAIVLCLLLFTGLALFSRGSGSPAAEPEPAEESAPTEATAAVTSVTLDGLLPPADGRDGPAEGADGGHGEPVPAGLRRCPHHARPHVRLLHQQHRG